MDSHTFSDPVPVPHNDEGKHCVDIPTWKVDVFRIGVDEPVGTLLVNDKNLPPRKNAKKKVAWRLPDSRDQIPKFGHHEQARLWELFKRQRKERRKKMKEQATEDEDGSPAPTSSNASPNRSDEEGGTPNEEEAAEAAPRTTVSLPAADTTFSTTDVLCSPATFVEPPGLPPPPPGFAPPGLDGLSIGHQPQQPPAYSAVRVPEQQQPMASVPSSLPFVLPPPRYFVVRAQALQPPPPPYAAATGVDVHKLSGSIQWQQHAAALAAQVASIFCQLIPTGRVPEWLAYYCCHHPSNSSETNGHAVGVPSSLLMGTAQASCPTLEDKWRQWLSLTTSATAAAPSSGVSSNASALPPQWECHGWTGQPVHHRNHATTGTREDDDQDDPCMYIVALTGQRQQEQQCFAFYLTLLLRRGYPLREKQHPTSSSTAAEEPPTAATDTKSDCHYQVCNEILGLTLLRG